MSDLTAWLVCVAALAALWTNGYVWYRTLHRDVVPRWWTIPILNGYIIGARRLPPRWERPATKERATWV